MGKRLGYCENCCFTTYKVVAKKEMVNFGGTYYKIKNYHCYCDKCGREITTTKYDKKIYKQLLRKERQANSTISKLDKEYKALAEKRKNKIRETKSRFKRFWKWVWYFISFPFVWLFYNIRDFRSAICVLISFLLWSSSVWVFYLLAILTGWNTTTGQWFIGIGTGVWAWWLSPLGSPFILIVVATSIGLKALLNLITRKK